MCMTSNPRQTRKFLSKHRNHTYVTAYKVVKVDSNYGYDLDGKYKLINKNLVGPYRTGYKYGVGLNSSNSRAKTALIDRYQDVEQGIHVCLTKEKADRMSFNLSDYGYSNKFKVLKVICRVDELRGVGNNGDVAVFKNIFIPRKQYRKAVGLDVSR